MQEPDAEFVVDEQTRRHLDAQFQVSRENIPDLGVGRDADPDIPRGYYGEKFVLTLTSADSEHQPHLPIGAHRRVESRTSLARVARRVLEALQ